MPADIDFHCDRADFARKSIAAVALAEFSEHILQIGDLNNANLANNR